MDVCRFVSHCNLCMWCVALWHNIKPIRPVITVNLTAVTLSVGYQEGHVTHNNSCTAVCKDWFAEETSVVQLNRSNSSITLDMHDCSESHFVLLLHRRSCICVHVTVSREKVSQRWEAWQQHSSEWHCVAPGQESGWKLVRASQICCRHSETLHVISRWTHHHGPRTRQDEGQEWSIQTYWPLCQDGKTSVSTTTLEFFSQQVFCR